MILNNVKITSIIAIVLFVSYFALHNVTALILLSKINIKYDACVDETCFFLDDGWLVEYNSDSFYGAIISKIYGDSIKTMSLAKIQNYNVIESAIYSKSPEKIDIAKFPIRKNLKGVDVAISSSQPNQLNNKSVFMYLDNYDIFITSTTENIPLRIKSVNTKTRTGIDLESSFQKKQDTP